MNTPRLATSLLLASLFLHSLVGCATHRVGLQVVHETEDWEGLSRYTIETVAQPAIRNATVMDLPSNQPSLVGHGPREVRLERCAIVDPATGELWQVHCDDVERQHKPTTANLSKAKPSQGHPTQIPAGQSSCDQASAPSFSSPRR